ncbi:MAG: hypothetical protein BWY55_00196 [archaeon ADurb.Bin336]|nr:MAG: hypothetical protein BWY55_00196 [archaeon ADurb.Bin336]
MVNNIISQNKKAHDKIFKVYNLKHSEIYNKIEQARLRKVILNIVKKVKAKEINVLDVGAGTGNLSLKFLDEGCKVIASDVSEKSLELLKKLSNKNKNLSVAMITNENLPFKDNEFDITCCYSVLHHVPDYINTVKEMIRVTKPGGFIYIDHEANENKWKPNKYLIEYYKKTNQTFVEHLIKLIKTRELFSFDFIKTFFIKTFVDKRYKREGDIHVWIDDHINWKKIRALSKKHCKIILEEDYLMYKQKVGLKEYLNLRKLCNDTKYILLKKL